MKGNKMKKINTLVIVFCLSYGVILVGKNQKEVNELDSKEQLAYIASSIITKCNLADKTIKKLKEIKLQDLNEEDKLYIKNLVLSYNTTVNKENTIPNELEKFKKYNSSLDGTFLNSISEFVKNLK